MRRTASSTAIPSIDSPSTAVMTSPGRSPAASAGAPLIGATIKMSSPFFSKVAPIPSKLDSIESVNCDVSSASRKSEYGSSRAAVIPSSAPMRSASSDISLSEWASMSLRTCSTLSQPSLRGWMAVGRAVVSVNAIVASPAPAPATNVAPASSPAVEFFTGSPSFLLISLSFSIAKSLEEKTRSTHLGRVSPSIADIRTWVDRVRLPRGPFATVKFEM